MRKFVLSLTIALLLQTLSYAAEIVPNATNQFVDANGNPLASGFVYMYVPGTTTPKNSWQDPDLTTLNTNPILLDSSGQARIWAADGAQYRQVVQDSTGNLIWDALTYAPGVLTAGGQPVTANEIASFADATGTVLKEGGPAQISGSNGVFLFDPNQTTQQQFKYTGTAAGTATTAPTDQAGSALLWYRQSGAIVGLGVNHHVALAEFDYNDTGSTLNNDSFVGMAANCNLLGARANAGIAGGTLAAACVGAVAASRGTEFQGGVLGSNQPQGEIHGLNVVAGVSVGNTTPSDYIDHEGIEVDMVGCVGCTVKYRIGVFSVDFGNGAGGAVEQGTDVDAAFAVASVGGTTGWKYGIDFVGAPLVTGFPLSNSGTVLGSSATTPPNASYGVDLNNFNISPSTNPAFRGPGGTFVVTGAGNVAGQSITANAGFITDAANAVNSVVQFRSANTPKWNITREATTNDLIVTNLGTNATNMRFGFNTQAISIGVVNGMSVNSTGGMLVPGVSTSVGTITGAVCMDVNKELIYKVGANCI